MGAQKLIQSFKHANTFTVQRYSNSIENLNSNKEVIRHISMEFDSENIGKLPNIEDIYNLLIADKSENETVFLISSNSIDLIYYTF